MNKQTPHISPQARQDATEWFITFREGDADLATRESFYTWLRRSPENVHAYLRITALWEDAELLSSSDLFDREALLKHARNETNVIPLEVPGAGGSGVSGLSPADAAELETGDAASVSLLNSNGEDKKTIPYSLSALEEREGPFGRVKLFAIAATLLVFIGIASAWFVTHQNTYVTDIGEQRTITLHDGSVIVLNARSRLRVNLTDNERKIDLLEGQAIFRVAHNPTRPFIVHTTTASIRAVGTQFDVYKKQTGTTVTVLEGRVAVVPDTAMPSEPSSGSAHAPSENTKTLPHSLSALEGEEAKLPSDKPKGWPGFSQERKGVAKPGEVLLIAGQQLTISAVIPTMSLPSERTPQASVAAQTILVPKLADLQAATAWTQGKLVFNETPLSEVVEEFNRYSPRRLVIDDPELQAFHISGVFPSSDPSRIAELLRQRFGVTIHESDDELRIARQ